MKRYIILALSLLLLASPALAQEKAAAAAAPVKTIPGPRNIAVIDIPSIMREAKVAKSLNSQMDVRRKKYRDEIAGLETGLEKTQKELLEQRKVLSEDDFKRKREDFEKRVKDVQALVQKRRQQLDSAEAEASKKVVEHLVQIVGTMAEKNSYQVVLHRSSVFLADKSLDISAEVVKQLDAKISSATLPPETSGQ